MLPNSRLTFKDGMDISADETDIQPGLAHDIVNIDISTTGTGFARDEYSAPSLLPGARCLQGFDSFALCAKDGLLYRIDIPLAATPIFSGLHPHNPVSYALHAGNIWFTDGVRVGMVTPDGTLASWVGLPVPGGPTVRAVSAGGLSPGVYGVALSFVTPTEESGISQTVFLNVTAGIELSNLPTPPLGAMLRVYLTQPDGDKLYFLMDIPNGLLGPILLGGAAEGKQATNQYLTQLPGGRLIAGYNGRLYVARGSVLYFSEPLYYGLTSARHGFIQYESEITVLQPVETGLYVGTREHVHYLSGEGPNAARTKLIAPPPVAWSGTGIVAGALDQDHSKRGGLYALWLSGLGYYLGTPDGIVTPLQADRIQGITAEAISSVVLATRGINRVVTTVE